MSEVSKGQLARIFDVVLIGPIMMWFGLTCGKGVAPNVLTALGVGTIFYNLHNYLSAQKPAGSDADDRHYAFATFVTFVVLHAARAR